MKSTLTKKNIQQIQNVVTKILRTSGGARRSLARLATDNCSEVSRLAGCFVLESWSDVGVSVLKGTNVLGTKKSHDVLALQKGDEVYVLDPSVWQFFPRKRSIFVGETKNIQDSLKVIQKRYGGTWKVSETLSLKTCRTEKGGWLDVINANNKN